MSSNLRARNVQSDAPDAKDRHVASNKLKAADAAAVPAHNTDEAPITVLDIIRLIFGLLLVNVLLSYFITGDSLTWGYKPWWLRPKLLMRVFTPPVVLTDDELARFDGTDPSLPIYLGLNGTIFDVSAGRMIYGPGGMYDHFAGRDAARAFVTGCFALDANPDLRGVEWTYVPKDVPRESETTVETAESQAYREAMLARARSQVEGVIDGWASLFRGETGKDYFEVGRIRRDEGIWDGVPIKPLCEAAEKARPRTDLEGSDAGEQYRKSKKSML